MQGLRLATTGILIFSLGPSASLSQEKAGENLSEDLGDKIASYEQRRAAAIISSFDEDAKRAFEEGNETLAQLQLTQDLLLEADQSKRELQAIGKTLAEQLEDASNYVEWLELRITARNLSCANLAGAVLSGACLESTRLETTVFGNVDLSNVQGLEKCNHFGPSILDHLTLVRSGNIPSSFLKGCGLSEEFITYLPSIIGSGIEFYSVFISYSSKDRDFAQRLHDSLQGKGIRCWFDQKSINPGDHIRDEIDFGVRIWDKVILCCSKDSLASDWVEDEVEKALEKERRFRKKRGERIKAIVPVDIDGFVHGEYGGSLKSVITSRSVGDFTNWKDHDSFERAMGKLIPALRTDGGKPPPPRSKL